MASKTSLWSELQREMDRHQRVAVARERSQQQMVRQLVQQRERAARQAARAETAERKRQLELAHEAGIAASKALKEQLEARLAELRTLLTSALRKPPELSFASLKRSPTVPSFDPDGLAEPLPNPAWDAFAPPLPGLLSGLVGGKARHARALEAAQADFDRALAEHQRAENDRVRQLNDARGSYERMLQGIHTEVREHNAAVDELEADFKLGGARFPVRQDARRDR
jgi:restriction system protein